jgi:hypothetical protein
MQNTVQVLMRVLFCLVVITVGSITIVAQNAITGTWTGNDSKWNNKHKGDDSERSEDLRDKIHLNFSFESEKGGTNNHGSSFAFEDLEGLSKAQVESANSNVSFRLAREAGTIDCTGTFQNGKGAGTFRFTPNRAFAEAMRSRGFEFTDQKMFSATTLDLRTADADDLLSSGFKNLTVSDLFKAKIFKVDSSFMREMASTGFPNLDMQDLVKARIFKVDANFVREVVQMGFKNDNFESLIKLRIFKITPDYLREMQTAGFGELSTEDAVKLRIFKVTPEFIREMEGAGLVNLSVQEATKLMIFKIDGDFVRRARAQENVDLSVSDLVRLKIHDKVK